MTVIGKDFLGLFSVAICCCQYIPLIYLTLRGRKRRHILSRLTWALAFGVTSLAQYLDAGGAGSWPNAFSALCSIAIALAAMRGGTAYITRSDWIFFIAALTAIPIWIVTKNPLAAVIWATIIDVAGYIPTFRKVWHYPYDEMAFAGVMSASKLALGLCALENYTLTTVLFPASGFIMEIIFLMIVLGRRYVQKPEKTLT